MKLIYVTSKLPCGPGEAFIIPEIQELMRQGHEVLVVPMYPRGEVFHNEAKNLLPHTRIKPLMCWDILLAGLKVLICKPLKVLSMLELLMKSRSRRILIKNLTIFPKALWLSTVARDWKAEHIHAHWASTSASMTMVASELSGVPWSLTAHRWDITENNLISQKARRAAFVRAIDRRGANNLMKTANFCNWKPYVIHMGVSIPAVSTKCISTSANEVIKLVMAANFVEMKGHEYLIEALRLLHDKVVSFRLDLLGGGALKTSIEHKVIQYRLEEKVKFLGPVPHEHLMAQLQAGAWDIMVLPSIEVKPGEGEGIPVSLMEAMSCGIPVISTNTGGIPELLGEDAGIMVPPKDPLALADAIERLAREPYLRNQLAEVGKRRIQESFKLEKVVTELSALFAGSKSVER